MVHSLRVGASSHLPLRQANPPRNALPNKQEDVLGFRVAEGREPHLTPASLAKYPFSIPSVPLAKVPGPKLRRTRQAVQTKHRVYSLNQNILPLLSENKSSRSEPVLGLQMATFLFRVPPRAGFCARARIPGISLGVQITAF